MNGCGGRRLERLVLYAIRAHPARLLLPCRATRSLSHASSLLSRVPRNRAIQAPPDDTPSVPPRDWPVKETKDADGRKYFLGGHDETYHYRHGTSTQGGYVKAAYTARATYLNPSTKILEYGRPIRHPLLILYSCNAVEDDEIWDEVSVLCDLATAITERDKDIRGFSPEKDFQPVEFIFVQARFHYNAWRTDEPWHITVDLGNRKTWNDGDGFFRKDYHVYALNDDLSQGYAGYCSSSKTKGKMKFMSPSQWDANPDGLSFTPWGQRDYYRYPHFRKILYETTQRSLEPPAVSQSGGTDPIYQHRQNPTPGTLKTPARTSIEDHLDSMLKSVHEGASKPARQGNGQRPPFAVLDYSGKLVNIREAVLSAQSEGKHIPPAWKVILQQFDASVTRRSKLSETSRSPAPVRATWLAREKTGSTHGTTSPTRRSPGPEGWDESDNSSAQQFDSPGLLGEGLVIRQEQPRASEAGSRGDMKSKWDKEQRSECRPRGSSVLQRPEKSKSTSRASRTNVTFRHLFKKDAGVSQADSASQELTSKANNVRQPVAEPDGSQPEIGADLEKR